MPDRNSDLISLLESELDFLEGGGYGQPAGEPTTERPIFYHSLVCINHWLVPEHASECHEDCVLLGAVPEAQKSAELPCHFIPLNDAGETVKSLTDTGDRARLEEAVKSWLRTTIQRLKRGENPLGSPEVRY